MHKYLIQIFWSEEDQGYIATVPALSGCSAWGETQQDALKEINFAIEAWIESCKKSGNPTPRPLSQDGLTLKC